MTFTPIISPIIIIVAVLIVLAIYFGFAFAYKGKMCFDSTIEKIEASLFVGATLLVFVALLNPTTYEQREVEIPDANMSVIIVLDNSASMWAEDGANGTSRWSYVQQSVKQITDEFSSARFSLITFNSTSKLLVPFTMDKQSIIEAVDVQRAPYRYYAGGTRLESFRSALDNVMENATEDSGKIYLFVLTDGENTSELLSMNSLEGIADGRIVGIGTANGGRIPDLQARENGQANAYALDEDGNEVISKINDDGLEYLSDNLNLSTVIAASVEDVSAGIEHPNADTDGTTTKMTTVPEYHYHIPLALCAIVFAIQAWLVAACLKNDRKEPEHER